MKTLANTEKRVAPAICRSQPLRFGYRGPEVKAQQAEIRAILRSTGAQAKLIIGQPNDKYEQEADRVADQVMRMSDADMAQRQPDNDEEEESLQAKPLADQITPKVQRQEELSEEEEETAQAKSMLGQSAYIQRMCPECEEEQGLQRQPVEEEEDELQTKSNSGEPPSVTPSLESRTNSLKGGGQPLDPATRSFFEPRFETGFSAVRVHDDTQAASIAHSINARAFTLGSNVVFGAGGYSPVTPSGRKLLAHELTHVVQQGGGKRQRIQRHVLENDPATAPGMSCDVATSSPAGVSLDVTFNISSSTLGATDKAAISHFVGNWHLAAVAEPVRVDGYASIDGTPNINWPLSCNRAETLARELMNPSDGTPGIPASSIELFAQGETDQFSSALEPNRRAQAHIPSVPTPPDPCPGGVKTVAVDFVRLHGSTISPATELAAANTIYRPCCIRFTAGATPPRESQATTHSWLNGDTDVNASGITCAATTTEERQMYDGGTAAHTLSSRMRVFLVETFSGYGAAGFSRPPYCGGGGYANHVVLANVASLATNPLAHEFGHILLNSGNHSTSPNLMAPSGGTVLSPTQCATCFRNA